MIFKTESMELEIESTIQQGKAKQKQFGDAPSADRRGRAMSGKQRLLQNSRDLGSKEEMH